MRRQSSCPIHLPVTADSSVLPILEQGAVSAGGVPAQAGGFVITFYLLIIPSVRQCDTGARGSLPSGSFASTNHPTKTGGGAASLTIHVPCVQRGSCGERQGLRLRRSSLFPSSPDRSCSEGGAGAQPPISFSLPFFPCREKAASGRLTIEWASAGMGNNGR